MATRPVLAISSCLLGNPVRYDGGNKRHKFITDILSQYFDFLPLCPELEAGLGVPRTPIKLFQTSNGLAALQAEGYSDDVTEKLRDAAKKTELNRKNISGLILKSKSPSCGIKSTPVKKQYNDQVYGAGIYAQELMNLYSIFPLCEETDLDQSLTRNKFLMAVCASNRFQQQVMAQKISLARFHAGEQLILDLLNHSKAQSLSKIINEEIYVQKFMSVYTGIAPSALQQLPKKLSDTVQTDSENIDQLEYSNNESIPLNQWLTWIRPSLSRLGLPLNLVEDSLAGQLCTICYR